jgi:hypothetical protein
MCFSGHIGRADKRTAKGPDGYVDNPCVRDRGEQFTRRARPPRSAQLFANTQDKSRGIWRFSTAIGLRRTQNGTLGGHGIGFAHGKRRSDHPMLERITFLASTADR